MDGGKCSVELGLVNVEVQGPKGPCRSGDPAERDEIDCWNIAGVNGHNAVCVAWRGEIDGAELDEDER